MTIIHLSLTFFSFSDHSFLIGRYDVERWPSHLDRPQNVRLADWLPLNDLLGSNCFMHHLKGKQSSLYVTVNTPNLQYCHFYTDSKCFFVCLFFLKPWTSGHPMARLFITHGGQNSLMQAVYHAVPVLAIPLFGDQFDNVVRAEAKGLGVAVRITHITRDVVSSTIQTIIHDIRYVGSTPKSRVQYKNTAVLGKSPTSPLRFPTLGSRKQLCP